MIIKKKKKKKKLSIFNLPPFYFTREVIYISNFTCTLLHLQISLVLHNFIYKINFFISSFN